METNCILEYKSPPPPPLGKELYYTLWRRLFDAGLVALESISPGKYIYYGTLRCRTLPSKKNYPMQPPAPWFLPQILLSPLHRRTIFPTKGRDRSSCYRFEYDLHLIKIPSHVDRESIFATLFGKLKHSHWTALSSVLPNDILHTY